jgi:hypothetical protein
MNTVKRKHDFVERPSILDDADSRSTLNNNPFKGFYNCLWVLSFFCLVTTPIVRLKTKGNLIDETLLESIKQDFAVCFGAWPVVPPFPLN